MCRSVIPYQGEGAMKTTDASSDLQPRQRGIHQRRAAQRTRRSVVHGATLCADVRTRYAICSGAPVNQRQRRNGTPAMANAEDTTRAVATLQRSFCKTSEMRRKRHNPYALPLAARVAVVTLFIRATHAVVHVMRGITRYTRGRVR